MPTASISDLQKYQRDFWWQNVKFCFAILLLHFLHFVFFSFVSCFSSFSFILYLRIYFIHHGKHRARYGTYPWGSWMAKLEKFQVANMDVFSCVLSGVYDKDITWKMLLFRAVTIGETKWIYGPSRFRIGCAHFLSCAFVCLACTTEMTNLLLVTQIYGGNNVLCRCTIFMVGKQLVVHMCLHDYTLMWLNQIKDYSVNNMGDIICLTVWLTLAFCIIRTA